MAQYILEVETTSNSTAGAAAANAGIQILAASGRDLRLMGLYVAQEATASGETDGRWVIDRISAVSAGSSATPAPLDPRSAASSIGNTSQCVSTTLVCGNTAVSGNAPCLEVPANVGWWMLPFLFYAGVSQGFALRRATAPTGARVVKLGMIWDEV